MVWIDIDSCKNQQIKFFDKISIFDESKIELLQVNVQKLP